MNNYNIQITKKDMLERFPFLNVTTLTKLGKSGRVKFTKIGNVKYYDNESVKVFEQNFNRKDYVKKGEFLKLLKSEGIFDFFIYFETNKNNKKVCKYERFVKSFPMSIKNLEKNGLLTIEKDFSPQLVKKSQLPIVIKKLIDMKDKGL